MYFPNILQFLSVCILTYYANSEETLHIDDSKFGSLELPNSPKKSKVAQQVTYFRDIVTVSNAIKNIQKRMKDEYTMDAYFTTNSRYSNNELEFKSIVSSFLQAELFSSENNSLPLFPEFTFNCTGSNCVHNGLKRINCTNSVLLNQTDTFVEVIDSKSRLYDILKPDLKIKNMTPALCSLVLYYDQSCEFSILAAPHFNIFPRIFPQIKMVAFNAVPIVERFIYLNGIPTLVLHHGGRPYTFYNGIEYTIEQFTKFVMNHTDLSPNEMVEITVSDFVKPILAIRKLKNDYIMWLSWIIVIFWTLYYAIKWYIKHHEQNN